MHHTSKIPKLHPLLRWVAFCLFFCLLSGLFPFPVAAYPAPPSPPDTSHAKAVLLYNAEYDVILLEQNADEVLYPASTVKIMTGYLSDKLLAGRMDETITVTEDMIKNVTGNSMHLQIGEKIRISDLYYGAICGGYNDACTALAVLASGSVEDFVTEMNETARTLGMTSTVYQNPTGLHSISMVSTARDILTLSLAASHSARYMETSSTVRHEIPATNHSDTRSFYNRNYLIASAVTTTYHNPYVDGLNAGMTNEGGWCLSARALRNDLTWHCVVLGGEEDEESGMIYAYEIANRVLSWGARGYTVKQIAKKGDHFGTSPITHAAIGSEYKEGLPLVAADDLWVFVPTSAEENEAGLSYAVRLYEPTLEAPIKKNREVGALVVTFNGEEVGRVPLLTSDAVTRNHFTYLLVQMKHLPENRIFLCTLFTFLALLALYIFRVTRFSPRRKRRISHTYVPRPFRHAEQPPRENAPPTQTRLAEKRPPSAAPPADPYADAARMLEERRKKPPQGR